MSNNKNSYSLVQRGTTTSTRSRDSASVSDALMLEIRIERKHFTTKDEEETKYQNVPKPQRIVASWLQNLQSHGLGACLLRSDKELLSLDRKKSFVCT